MLSALPVCAIRPAIPSPNGKRMIALGGTNPLRVQALDVKAYASRAGKGIALVQRPTCKAIACKLVV